MHKATHPLLPSCLFASLGLLLACGAQDSGEPRAQSVEAIGQESDAGDEAIGQESDAGDEGTSATVTGDATRGAALAERQACGSCHSQDYSGGPGGAANITPDEATGIGAWSNDEIADAIVNGVDADGETLCALMPQLALSESDLADLVAFLRSVQPVSHEVSEICAGHGS
jgi:mono/diheme cytochrome c family protein